MPTGHRHSIWGANTAWCRQHVVQHVGTCRATCWRVCRFGGENPRHDTNITSQEVHCHCNTRSNQCVPTSSFLIPSLASPIAPTVSRSGSITWSDVTCAMIPLLKTDEMGEFWEVPGYFLILFTIAATDQTGQRDSPDSIWFIVSIFSSFFCLLKVIETQFAHSNSGWSWLSCSPPQKNQPSRSLAISILLSSGWCTLR